MSSSIAFRSFSCAVNIFVGNGIRTKKPSWWVRGILCTSASSLFYSSYPSENDGYSFGFFGPSVCPSRVFPFCALYIILTRMVYNSYPWSIYHMNAVCSWCVIWWGELCCPIFLCDGSLKMSSWLSTIKSVLYENNTIIFQFLKRQSQRVVCL